VYQRGLPRRGYNKSLMPFEEVVEAEGHLIDSHIMENMRPIHQIGLQPTRFQVSVSNPER